MLRFLGLRLTSSCKERLQERPQSALLETDEGQHYHPRQWHYHCGVGSSVVQSHCRAIWAGGLCADGFAAESTSPGGHEVQTEGNHSMSIFTRLRPDGRAKLRVHIWKSKSGKMGRSRTLASIVLRLRGTLWSLLFSALLQVGITQEDCGKRKCKDWLDFRMNCTNSDSICLVVAGCVLLRYRR